MSLTLYYHPLASFCHKVLIALYENDTAFDRRFIDLADDKDRAELAAVWPIGKFPVIRDSERRRDVAETSIIIEYLDRFFPGKRPLIPGEWEDALSVRQWDRFCDHYVQGPVQQIVGDHLRGAKADMSQQRAMLRTAFAMIDGQMAGREWMAGQGFSMADCAAAPALFFGSTIEPVPQRYGHLRKYFDRLMDRPSVRRVFEEAKPYFALYPFAEAIPKRFR
ncbi:MAG: glutathione S-transferase family protein [Pseudomonadota bacterium]|nr:glutathione S-transferase family protein [Pseudomonadota bacterium]